MIDGTVRTTWSIEVGGLSRDELIERLDARGIPRNAYAEILLADPVFDDLPRQTVAGATVAGAPVAGTLAACQAPARETISILETSVGDLGLPDGATLPRVFDAAARRGLALCPPITAPYLRLATLDQASAPDSILSTGRAPTGSLHVVSPPLRADHDYPKGFYLRVIDGVPWLRGYRCDDEYVWSPGDRLAFRVLASGPHS